MGSPNVANADISAYASCHWHIWAPDDYQIAIEVLEVGNVCSEGCFYGNLELKPIQPANGAYPKDVTTSGVRWANSCNFILSFNGQIVLFIGFGRQWGEKALFHGQFGCD